MTDMAAVLLDAARTRLPSIRPMVVLDWRDGPIEGIAKVMNPVSYWYFSLFAEQTYSERLDERVYTFSFILESAMERIVEVAGSFEEKPLVWPYETGAVRDGVEALVDSAIASADPAALLVSSADFRTVNGMWRLLRAV